MKRTIVLAGTVCLVAGLAGCSSNPGEAQLNADIGAMRKAAAQCRVIKDKVNEALAKSKDNKLDLKAAVNAVIQLKEDGKEMQLIREHTDLVKDNTTPEQRQDLVKRFKEKFEEAGVELQKAEEEMDAAIRKADEHGPKEAVEELKKTLVLAMHEFEMLAKQQ